MINYQPTGSLQGLSRSVSLNFKSENRSDPPQGRIDQQTQKPQQKSVFLRKIAAGKHYLCLIEWYDKVFCCSGVESKASTV